jgi:hypothetical protein
MTISGLVLAVSLGLSTPGLAEKTIHQAYDKESPEAARKSKLTTHGDVLRVEPRLVQGENGPHKFTQVEPSPACPCCGAQPIRPARARFLPCELFDVE